MFYKVMKTFLFLFGIYVFIILAFGLAFFIVLHKDETDNIAINESNTVEYVFFDTTWLALMKTSAMIVGELQFEDIPIFNIYSKDSARILTYVFLLIFVFLIVIVLTNLLNGLAVSDVAKIEAEAEFYVLSSRLQTIIGRQLDTPENSGWFSELLLTENLECSGEYTPHSS